MVQGRLELPFQSSISPGTRTTHADIARPGCWLGACDLLSAPVQAEPAPCDVIGFWKLTYFGSENMNTNVWEQPFGKNPKGYLTITPERIIAIITTELRKAPLTDADRASGFDTMLAYSGPYWIDRNRLTVRILVVWTRLGRLRIRSMPWVARAIRSPSARCPARQSTSKEKPACHVFCLSSSVWSKAGSVGRALIAGLRLHHRPPKGTPARVQLRS